MQISKQHSSPQDNAMTEIALALAMGFFSIMVLAMVSMGVSSAPQQKSTAISAVTLAQSAPTSSGNVETNNDDTLVVFDGRRFLDRDLKPIDLASIDPTHRIILAVDPVVSMADAIAARARIPGGNVIVATLNDAWRAALSRRSDAKPVGGPK